MMWSPCRILDSPLSMYCPSSNNGCPYLLRSVAADHIRTVVHPNENNCCSFMMQLLSTSKSINSSSFLRQHNDYYSAVKNSAPSNEARYKVLHNSFQRYLQQIPGAAVSQAPVTGHSVPDKSQNIMGDGFPVGHSKLIAFMMLSS